MATLKDLIKTETLKVGATSCAPSGSVVDLAGILRDGNTEYVLPESGYVSLCAPSPINTWAGLSCNEIASQARSDATDSWVTHHIYGKKGDVVKITVDKVSRIGWVRFVKAIGGGYKRYLKALACNRFGGSSWLRLKTTSETLRKEARTLASWRTSRLASTTRPLLGSGQIQSLRPTTVSLQSSGKMLGWFSYLHSTLESKVYRQREYALHTYLLKKGQGLTTSFNLRGKFLFVDSYQFSLASNNVRMEVAA